jgi:hypothetical protein
MNIRKAHEVPAPYGVTPTPPAAIGRMADPAEVSWTLAFPVSADGVYHGLAVGRTGYGTRLRPPGHLAVADMASRLDCWRTGQGQNGRDDPGMYVGACPGGT